MQEQVYDNRGQVVETIRYGAPVALQGLNGGLANDALRLAIAATSNADVDIHATYAYTQDGRVAKETDGAGGVIEHSYDAFGNEIQRLTKIAGAISRTAVSYTHLVLDDRQRFGRVLNRIGGHGGVLN